MKQSISRLLVSMSFILMTVASVAQVTLSGKVLESGTSEPLIGATVYEVNNTSNGTATDLDGSFTLQVASLPTRLVISYTGYQSQTIEVTDAAMMSISLDLGTTLDEIVITGSRGKPRSILDSPVPIDNINAAELMTSGQRTVEQMINYKVPSYNSSNQTISDATAHFDPSELRNLGPSRTLVLINGKRKNQSALVYVNDTPGKGEVGTDMKSIPAAAIERIEVLRDGASAQYGSDAIAGVINIILKDGGNDGVVNFETGATTQGDGFQFNADFNKGWQIGNGGFNLTGNFFHQDLTNRAGEPGSDALFGVAGSNPWIQDNPDLGMTIGQPAYDKYSLFGNLTLPNASGTNEIYASGGYTYRDSKSFALYRAPYWVTTDFGLLTEQGRTYQGFQPTFETDIDDITITIGDRFDMGAWDADVSFTTGQNSVDYTVDNSINVDLGSASPTTFNTGGYRFGHILGNVDVSRSIDAFTLSLGAEIRREQFEAVAGQEESYTGSGAQSFPGLQPSNELKKNRNNFGIYAGLDWDISESFLLGGAIRFEDYSDFGSNVSWKVNARQLLGNNMGAIRASVSTGFRAPSLHQIYLSNIQTLVSGGTVSNQGTFNNESDVVRGLGIDALDAETALNFTAGLTFKLTNKINFSLDYYNISLDDRVLFTGEVGGTGNPSNSLDMALAAFDVTSIKFFINAMDTKTEGLDFVLNFNDISLGNSNQLDLIFALNANNTDIEGTIQTPDILENAGINIFNRKEQSRVTSARPDLKFTVGSNWTLGDFTASLNNTYFGEVTWQHASNLSLDQTFGAKVITDLILGYRLSDDVSVDLTINNLFDVYPDVIETGGDVVTDLGGRFRYPWEVNQFGFNGAIYKIGATIKL
ncbi:MAG: TonB-dependent receptor [Bacteroidia bacterium]|nr:TonB-dependent receptor [Bacteroidia bacterium]